MNRKYDNNCLNLCCELKNKKQAKKLTKTVDNHSFLGYNKITKIISLMPKTVSA